MWLSRTRVELKSAALASLASLAGGARYGADAFSVQQPKRCVNFSEKGLMGAPLCRAGDSGSGAGWFRGVDCGIARGGLVVFQESSALGTAGKPARHTKIYRAR